ncbi:MAG: hypothetical protein PVH84_10905 [Candidatus Aminicenantes bacterium]|jgi:hypothetical protein
MRRTRSIPFVAVVIFLLFYAAPAKGDWYFDAEGGYVWPGYIDVRIPNETGTLFSLKDDLPAESKIVYRLRLGYQFHPKHSVSVLFAPLGLNAQGSVDKDIFFNEDFFPANTDIKAFYKFNSYRLTYRFDFVNSEKWKVGLGLTAKIRDAEVRLEDAEKSSSNTDFGFVPLLNFRVHWMFSPKMSLLLEGDALASPGGQGRAEDVLLALFYRLSERVSLKAGYRILEGGADVESVYNFTLLNYLVAGAVFRF